MKRSYFGLVGALLLSLIGACKTAKFIIESERVAAPSACRWSHASVKLHYKPSRSGGHGRSSEQFNMHLSLERGGKQERTQLDYFLKGDRPGHTSSGEFRALHKTSFKLSFAPDGHALALSRDGGKSYRLIALDAGDRPLYCHHVVFDLKAGWTRAPNTHDLALEILASADPPIGKTRLHLEPGEYPASRARYEHELEGAVSYACAHLDDKALREAVIPALVRPGKQQPLTSDSLVACAGRIAKQHADQRGVLLSALRSAPARQKRRAALAAARIGDTKVEDALVHALKSAPAPCEANTAECTAMRFDRLTPAWALGSVVTIRGAVSDDTLKLLLALSRDSDEAMQIYAVRALAVSKDPRAKARLKEMAADPCKKPLDAWTDKFVKFNEAVKDRGRTPACWARAAGG